MSWRCRLGLGDPEELEELEERELEEPERLDAEEELEPLEEPELEPELLLELELERDLRGTWDSQSSVTPRPALPRPLMAATGNAMPGLEVRGSGSRPVTS